MRERMSVSCPLAAPRSRSRSANNAASMAASGTQASALARSNMCARRGCTLKVAIFLPCAVMRPAASIASSLASKSCALPSMASGGGSSHLRSLAARTPIRQIQCERREIRRQDLRWGERHEALLRLRAPCSIAHAARHASRSALALFGRCARDALGFKAAHARHRIKDQAAHEARVDDGPHALDGETRLGDVGRKNNLARALRTWSQCRILIRARKITEER